MNFTGYPPADKSFGGVQEDTLDRISRLERRRGLVFDPMWTAGKTVKGVLDPMYRGWGPAKVTVDGVLSASPYNWATPYVPNAGREVRLTWDGTEWVILGQTIDGYSGLSFADGSFDIYSIRSTDDAWNIRIRSVRLPSGIVVLSGMIIAVGTPPAGTKIFTLPEGHRPPHTIALAIENGDVARTVYIEADGDVVSSAQSAAGAYTSLDGLAFPAADAGAGEWTAIGAAGSGSSFGANFEAWTNPAFGVPSYWKDPWGFVWFRGLLRVKVATAGDNTSMVVLPASHRSARQMHLRANGNDSYAGIGSMNTNGLNWKPGSPGTVGQWIGLDGICLITTQASNLPGWSGFPVWQNTWGAYPGSGGDFETPGYLRREDGLCLMRGMMNGGSVGARAGIMVREEMWPSGGKIIVAAMSNNGRARLDISPAREKDAGEWPGGFLPRGGSNAWWSLDQLKWVP